MSRSWPTPTWLPEVIATLAPDRRILFAWSAAGVSELGRIAVDRGFRQLTVLSSTAETGYVAPRPGGSPGLHPHAHGTGGVGERGLILHRYACDLEQRDKIAVSPATVYAP